METTKCLLVIDDEGDIREVTQVSLEMVGGWQVVTACSGSEGLTKAREGQPEAILLDMMMPGMDGITTFQKLQADPKTQPIPVLFLTAKVQPADRRRFANRGVKGVIAKPFDPLTLADEIAKALSWN
jgi:two-component system alkaline phosphatase synthesis response regulator PhoP